MKSNTMLVAAALGLATMTVPCQVAEAQSFSQSRIIDSFDLATLRTVAAELDATVDTNDDGGYTIFFANRTVSSVKLTACRSDTCLGTHLTATFGKPSDKTVSQTEEIVRDFNRNHRTLTVYNLGNGRSQADLYIIADGGITMQNYLRQLSLYSFMLKEYRKAIYTNG